MYGLICPGFHLSGNIQTGLSFLWLHASCEEGCRHYSKSSATSCAFLGGIEINKISFFFKRGGSFYCPVAFIKLPLINKSDLPTFYSLVK